MKHASSKIPIFTFCWQNKSSKIISCIFHESFAFIIWVEWIKKEIFNFMRRNLTFSLLLVNALELSFHLYVIHFQCQLQTQISIFYEINIMIYHLIEILPSRFRNTHHLVLLLRCIVIMKKLLKEKICWYLNASLGISIYFAYMPSRSQSSEKVLWES